MVHENYCSKPIATCDSSLDESAVTLLSIFSGQKGASSVDENTIILMYSTGTC